ncbi:hypothetical protein ml_117 [Mollivirus sibericum]|uniref:hypothetical protein n=1 Tax=Mollivirus sibericum TaxID=1678078 RepID=UPI0006B2DB33|nr:hypothetical protein ml_117 [Mollivirus sibericum]ALD61919.1 hypothetical protein ml_117 [Mollivirus sibericum]
MSVETKQQDPPMDVSVDHALNVYDEALCEYEAAARRTGLCSRQLVADAFVEVSEQREHRERLSDLHKRHDVLVQDLRRQSDHKEKKRKHHPVGQETETLPCKRTRKRVECDIQDLPPADSCPSEWMAQHWDKAEAWLRLCTAWMRDFDKPEIAIQCVRAWPLDSNGVDTPEVKAAKLEAFKRTIEPYHMPLDGFIDKFRGHPEYTDYLLSEYARRVDPALLTYGLTIDSLEDFEFWRPLADVGIMTRTQLVCEHLLSVMKHEDYGHPMVVADYRELARHALRWAVDEDNENLADEDLVRRAMTTNYDQDNSVDSDMIEGAINLGLLDPVPPVRGKPWVHFDHYFYDKWHLEDKETEEDEENNDCITRS